MTTIYDFTVRDVADSEIPLRNYRGKVLLIVNTASRCGFTPQYAGLQALHREMSKRGLVVLGFPCNQFGAQEPGEGSEIADFCQLAYDVSFPLFAKISVNGPKAHPLFQWLKSQAPGLFGTKAIKWNFTKFIVDREGEVVSRHAPNSEPQQLRQRIMSLL
ncbi:glutathione peroxidase [Rhizobium leguminosarum bv. trifolii WSM597]|uniref:Glutathione peroxidase n=1 Tax=Rhizobium leguminosarum bv. trifolii WSM597 TaxID=754764 RepID=I9X5Q8_RHILT|nr:glutathione peroxidase [Rhizobium leguminosarum]EJB04141.1 glutathione peroxidase [Rhizobium leguminosarum bv. trifolii WSM597]